MEPKGTGERSVDKPSSSSSSEIKLPVAYQGDIPLAVMIERNVRQYFRELGEEQPSNLYEVMLLQLEKPLLTVVLEHTRGNQTRTAEILGLNRGTLRKKLKTHHLM